MTDPPLAFYPHSGLDQVPGRNIAPPLTRGTGHRNSGNPLAVCWRGRVRLISAREAERLQGYQPDWTRGASHRGRYAELGDSVPIPILSWLGRELTN